MNVESVKTALRQRYPNANIVVVNGGAEIIAEIEPGRAVAVIERNQPHFHRHTIETYRVLEGSLVICIAGNGLLLSAGEECVIQLGQIHWGRCIGSAAWIEISSNPPWSKEDHIVI